MGGAGILVISAIAIILLVKGLYPGEWLRRAGPFEISEGKLGQTEDGIEFWHQAAMASREEAARLRERLEHFDESVGSLGTS